MALYLLLRPSQIWLPTFKWHYIPPRSQIWLLGNCLRSWGRLSRGSFRAPTERNNLLKVGSNGRLDKLAPTHCQAPPFHSAKVDFVSRKVCFICHSDICHPIFCIICHLFFVSFATSYLYHLPHNFLYHLPHHFEKLKYAYIVVADMEVDMVADMGVDKVANKVADMVAEIFWKI